jgi:cellulose synthase/poly-beta-1,6-N-acetylglucosamine synthase-like glycosyltransferase
MRSIGSFSSWERSPRQLLSRSYSRHHRTDVLTDRTSSPTSRRRYRSPIPRSSSSSAPSESVPGVSILRPLKGLDTNLFENLESTFHQEYPNFEIIFSVANEYDQALSVVRALLEKYPHSDARVIVGS